MFSRPRRLALAPSLRSFLPLSRSLPPSLSLPTSLICLIVISVFAVEAPQSSCFPPARSRAHSSPSFQLFVSSHRRLSASRVYRLSSLIVQLQPARSCDSPATRDTFALSSRSPHLAINLLPHDLAVHRWTISFRRSCRNVTVLSKDQVWPRDYYSRILERK